MIIKTCYIVNFKVVEAYAKVVGKADNIINIDYMVINNSFITSAISETEVFNNYIMIIEDNFHLIINCFVDTCIKKIVINVF